MNRTDPITAQEWEQLTYWRRKKLYFFARYIVAKGKRKKFFQFWTLPNFAIRQIQMAQGSLITVNDQTTEQTDLTEWKRLYSLSTPEERLETMLLMLTIIETRQEPTAANPDEEVRWADCNINHFPTLQRITQIIKVPPFSATRTEAYYRGGMSDSICAVFRFYYETYPVKNVKSITIKI